MLKGTGVALITPFLRSGEIDEKALETIVKRSIEGGCNFLVVMGTTAEYPTLSSEERTRAIRVIKKANSSRLPMVLGIGGYSTSDVIKEIEDTPLDDFYAILSVVPYYNRPNQSGIYNHFATIASKSPIPIILYNIPARTGTNMTAQTSISLAKNFPNIIGIKEASGDMEQYMALINMSSEDFAVYSGDDSLAVPVTLMGGSGVISVAANVFPEKVSQMIHFALEKNAEKAIEIHYDMLDFVHLLFREGNPVGAKTALELLNVCSGAVRLPMVEGSEELRADIQRFLLR